MVGTRGTSYFRANSDITVHRAMSSAVGFVEYCGVTFQGQAAGERVRQMRHEFV